MPKMARAMMKRWISLGLGYLVLRQPGWSLPGGEAHRLKLTKKFARPTKATALYVLDEPTVGLQATDVALLVRTLATLVAAGNSALVVEHAPAFLTACDWRLSVREPGQSSRTLHARPRGCGEDAAALLARIRHPSLIAEQSESSPRVSRNQLEPQLDCRGPRSAADSEQSGLTRQQQRPQRYIP